MYWQALVSSPMECYDRPQSLKYTRQMCYHRAASPQPICVTPDWQAKNRPNNFSTTPNFVKSLLPTDVQVSLVSKSVSLHSYYIILKKSLLQISILQKLLSHNIRVIWQTAVKFRWKKNIEVFRQSFANIYKTLNNSFDYIMWIWILKYSCVAIQPCH